MKAQFLSRPFAFAWVFIACAPQTTTPSATPTPAVVVAPEATPAEPPARAADDARGARLYDNWRSEKKLAETFVPDSSKTPEADGKGGPFGNGTLDDGSGKPLLNTGHDYRLKNLFGWDLRGTAGVYGPDYQKKSYVLVTDLLSDKRSTAELRVWFEKGGNGVPALGAVLDARDLDDLVAFVDKTRTGVLAGPAAVFTLDKAAPKGFVLNAGGDAARGKKLYADSCAGCHAADGRKFAIDETESVGTLSRTSGYEIWFKILHGQPGSPMGRQVTEVEASAQATAILDLFAALCDRSAFPPIGSGEDVKNGDVRCGAYLR